MRRSEPRDARFTVNEVRGAGRQEGFFDAEVALPAGAGV